MQLAQWRTEILWVMGPEGMTTTEGCGAMDKGMADQGHLRLVRRFEIDKEGKFVDHKLEQRAPLLSALLKIIMEEHKCDQVALQQMLHQKMHCDPHAASVCTNCGAGGGHPRKRRTHRKRKRMTRAPRNP
jgi:hypothetical protein